MNEQEILALLREAYAIPMCSDEAGYRRRMNRARAAIRALEDDRALLGEWLLVSAYESLWNFEAFCHTLEEAAELMDGRSQVLPFRAFLTRDFYDLFGICNALPGHADANAERIDRAEALFYRLTGGGKGAGACYRAQLAHYRGRFGQARELAEEALELGRLHGQELICLCAAETMANLAKHMRDDDLWAYALQIITHLRDYGKDQPSRTLAELVCCCLDMSMGLLQSAPAWLREGELGALPSGGRYRMVGGVPTAGAFPLAMILRMEYLAYQGRYVAALNVAEAMTGLYHLKNLSLNAYVHFLRAVCFLGLGDCKRMRAALAMGVATVAPDGLWLVAAEFAPPLGDALYSAATRLNPEAPGLIRAMGEGFWEKLRPLREDAVKGAAAGLSLREREVAGLLKEGRKTTEIAQALHISTRTVEAHLQSLYRKLGVHRRALLPKALEGSTPELAHWIDKK